MKDKARDNEQRLSQMVGQKERLEKTIVNLKE